MAKVLALAVETVREKVSKKLVDSGVPLTLKMVHESLDYLRGAVMIVYPMNLPPYDPIRMEFEGKEDLSGTQDSLQVISKEEAEMVLWQTDSYSGGEAPGGFYWEE